MLGKEDRIGYLIVRLKEFNDKLSDPTLSRHQRRTFQEAFDKVQEACKNLGQLSNIIEVRSSSRGIMYLTGISLDDANKLLSILYPNETLTTREVSPKKWYK